MIKLEIKENSMLPYEIAKIVKNGRKSIDIIRSKRRSICKKNECP